jgi:hypothetical protein
MLTVVKRNRRERSANFVTCSNGCMKLKRAKGGPVSLGLREAFHFAVILGREVPLCPVCAKAWPGLWDDAHDEVEAVRAFGGVR